MAGWIVVGGLAVLALAAVLPVRAQFRHGRHERPPPRTDPGELEDEWARGSMDLRADLAVHHELPPWWVDPVPWEHLASDERIKTAEYPLPWPRLEGDWLPQPPPGMFWPAPAPEPSEAEVAASRALHGYIPELDPGPEAAAPAPSPDQNPPGEESSTTGGGHSSHPATSITGSRAALQAEPSNLAGGLGPRAGAVLAAYEQRLGARREACT